jgi:hypothetical protein
MKEIKKDPWTDPDPQPGDFDEAIELGEVEWVDLEVDPDLEIELISDEEAARRRSLVDAPNSPESAKPAKR